MIGSLPDYTLNRKESLSIFPLADSTRIDPVECRAAFGEPRFSGPIYREAVGWGKIAQIHMALSAGTRLGPYEIVAPIGSGGMGEVYRAHDSRLERDVAIKVLPERPARDPQALALPARSQGGGRPLSSQHPGDSRFRL